MTKTFTINSEGTSVYVLECPPGKDVLGGGWQRSSDKIRVLESYPQGHAWEVSAVVSGGPVGETLYVIATSAAVR